MSLQSVANRPSSRQKIQDMAIAQDATREIEDYLEDCYGLELTRILTEEELKLQRLVRWMRNRADIIHKTSLSAPIIEFEGRDLYRWSVRFDAATMHYVGVKRRTHDQVVFGTRLFPHSLINLGVDTPAKGNRFMDLYIKLYNPTRSWVSGCQINQQKVADIALTPDYNRLPEWVKSGLMNAPDSANIGGDRIGNIWRLIPCVKAWKWADLPKRVAEKIGKCSPKMRMLAAIAWKNRDTEVWEPDCRQLSRTEQIADFYQQLSALESLPLAEQCHWAFESCVEWGRTRWQTFLTESLGLPWGLIELPKEVTQDAVDSVILQYGTPQQACQAFLGLAGKATIKAFKASDKTRIKWAAALCDGNPDAAQKILAMPECIAFESDAVDFLRSLPMQSRIRLLGSTTFKYRGETCDISADHVRDTGYLWKNIQNQPELGRVRNWFSVHEALAAAFVKELPDEALPIPAGWDRLDGLCAVDGSWSLEFPKRVATLKYWGQIQRNCVGGYGPAIKSGRSIVFAVHEYGQITHLVEYTSTSNCNQFYSYGNGSPDYAVKESVMGAIAQAFS